MKRGGKIRKGDAGEENSTPKAARTRQSLLKSARTLFARGGYDAAAVSDIVAKSKVSQGTFYYHFEDKRAVLLAILDDFFARADSLAASWQTTTDAGQETIERFAGAVATIIYENRETIRIMNNEANSQDPKVREKIRGFYGSLYGRVTVAMDLGMKLGFVRPLDARTAAVATVGMIKEVVEDIIERREEFDREGVIAELTGLINFGIRPAKFAGRK